MVGIVIMDVNWHPLAENTGIDALQNWERVTERHTDERKVLEILFQLAQLSAKSIILSM